MGGTFSRSCRCGFAALQSGFLAAALLAGARGETAEATEFAIRQIADEAVVNRDPVVSEAGLVAWYAYEKGEEGEARSEVYVYADGERRALTKGVLEPGSANVRPQVSGRVVVWQTTLPYPEGPPDWTLQEVPVREGEPPELDATYEAFAEPDGFGGSLGRQWFVGPGQALAPTGGEEAVTNAIRPLRAPSGENEICLWDGSEVVRLTKDARDDLAPSVAGRMVAWQKAKGWPFGWEIMVWEDGWKAQLTTNYYYDMAPKVHGSQVVWYGWDGQDYEVYLFDKGRDIVLQITSNTYDDVAPQIHDGVVAWEGYASVEADVFLWKNGEVRRLSDNTEDDIRPRTWNGRVVWQGFDGSDYEIFYFDGEKTQRLTSNTYDDLAPEIGDGWVVWMAYPEGGPGEIFVWDGEQVIRLTENDYEDRNPRTAGHRIVWEGRPGGKSLIYLAEPR